MLQLNIVEDILYLGNEWISNQPSSIQIEYIIEQVGNQVPEFYSDLKKLTEIDFSCYNNYGEF